MNYTTLVAAIPAWVNNYSTELSAQLDTIIGLAETRLVRDADLRAYRKHSTASMISGDPYITLPSGVLAIRSLRIRTGAFLEFRPDTWIEEYTSNVSTTGTPKYWSHWDADTIVVAPSPDSTATIELSWIKKPDSIVTASTTWLGDNAEDALLKACVLEAGIFLQVTPEQLAAYTADYNGALKTLNDQEKRAYGEDYRF